MHDAGSERARRSVRIEIRKRADRDYTRLAQFEQGIAQPDFGRQAIVCFYKNIRLEKPDISQNELETGYFSDRQIAIAHCSGNAAQTGIIVLYIPPHKQVQTF